MSLNDETPQIRDIPKFREMRLGIRGFKLLKYAFLISSPLLRLLGVNTKEMRKTFKELKTIDKEFRMLSELPDKFNEIFSARGWIIYEFLNVEIAQKAIEIAKNDLDEAETFLVNFYTPEMVETYLSMMHGVKAFRPRMDLARKALLDYREERYHACVPVILALMDGLVNDIHNLGLFTEYIDLNAWDSISAHEKGLNVLKRVLFATRKKTRTEQINVPYRNGIMHGMDLGYDNKMVAAKTWAALFSVRDWAAKAEQKELIEPPPKPQASWTDLIQQLQENKALSEKLEQWQSRNIIVGKDIPAKGKIEDFPENTPERKVVEFLTYWQKNNYGYMADCVALTFRSVDLIKRIRTVYSNSKLNDFVILSVKDEAPAITEVTVSLDYELHEQAIKKDVVFRMLIEKNDRKPAMFGSSDALWGIVTWGIL
jgi:hypothetical protein